MNEMKTTITKSQKDTLRKKPEYLQLIYYFCCESKIINLRKIKILTQLLKPDCINYC